jgi:hypothetical protein
VQFISIIPLGIILLNGVLPVQLIKFIAELYDLPKPIGMAYTYE